MKFSQTSENWKTLTYIIKTDIVYLSYSIHVHLSRQSVNEEYHRLIEGNIDKRDIWENLFSTSRGQFGKKKWL